MSRKLLSLAGLAAALLLGPVLGQTGSAGPITISGGYQVDRSSPVSINTVYGARMADNATPVPLGSYDLGTGSGRINVGDANSIYARLASITLPTIGSSATVQVLQLAFTNITLMNLPGNMRSVTAAVAIPESSATAMTALITLSLVALGWRRGRSVEKRAGRVKTRSVPGRTMAAAPGSRR